MYLIYNLPKIKLHMAGKVSMAFWLGKWGVSIDHPPDLNGNNSSFQGTRMILMGLDYVSFWSTPHPVTVTNEGL